MKYIKPTFQGEIQLAGWSDTHNGGRKVTFWLADEDDLEPFKGLTARKGNQAGHRFMAVLVEIGDDEKPIVQPQKEKLKGGELCRLAGIFCSTKEFWQWVSETNDVEYITNQNDAVIWLREKCEIESRTELDHDSVAGNIFKKQVREPYSEWHYENFEKRS